LAGKGWRSASTRKSGNSSGFRCTSSITTSPSKDPSASEGFSNRRASVGSSKSKYSAFFPLAKCRANAVLPHCRGPSKAAIRLRRRAVSICRHNLSLLIHMLEILTRNVKTSRKEAIKAWLTRCFLNAHDLGLATQEGGFPQYEPSIEARSLTNNHETHLLSWVVRLTVA
jgi:hypothetical protein